MAKMPTPLVLNDWGDEQLTLTVHVRLSYPFRARLWLAFKLIALACWLGKFGFAIDQEEESGDSFGR